MGHFGGCHSEKSTIAGVLFECLVEEEHEVLQEAAELSVS